jgi:mannose-6-phosphate isomerase-like protein (cupin superfamily)
VFEGQVELTVGKSEPILLEPGDSAYYRSDVPHSFRNAGRGVARFFGVTTPPNL